LLAQLCKQTWFVVLMVFVISWSSVAFASVKPLHQQMMDESAAIKHQPTAMANCHQSQHTLPHMQQHSAEHDQHHFTVHHIEPDSDCHQHTSDHDHQQHFSCNDCVQLHCQSLTTWLDAQIPSFVHLTSVQEQPQLNADYSAQHLSGFWQKILRPPKA